MYNKSIQAYKVTKIDSELAVADPHKVIQLMYQGLLERLAQTKGAIDRKDFEAKSKLISKSMAIINGLNDSLDMSQGEISENLSSLYLYMNDRLFAAGKTMDNTLIDEVAGLVITIKSAWDQIPDSAKTEAYNIKNMNKS